MPTEGSCNCGSVKVSIAELPKQTILCHCANCRRAGSAAFTVNYVVAPSNVEVKDPEGAMKSYMDRNTLSGDLLIRKFCGNCGSPIMSVTPDAPVLILKGGLLDHVTQPDSEVFAHNKLPWLEVTKVDEQGAKA